MMSNETVVIIDGDSVVERDMTEAELEQLAKDRAYNAAFNAEMLPKEQAIAEKKAAAEAKLAALGLTTEDLNALGL
jgi:hypothetical protein